MAFFGRKEQLKRISRELSAEKLRTVLIYGRRRIGKSELVKQCLRESSFRSVYYECKQVAEATNTRGLCDIVSEKFGLPKLGFEAIEEALDFIFQRALDEPVILVLDEYPYLRENIRGLDSIIQSLIDKYRESSNLKLFLLGSYVETMKLLLEHSNPLFGRVDLTIDLKQMDYYESALFYPEFSDEDKVRIYSVFGGIPYYNRLVNDKISVRENIIDLIASPEARLENEVSMYLNSEISKITNANEVFEALSRGFSKYSDILSQSHVSSGPSLADVLEKLVKMGVVVKTSPINDENNKKKSGYFICDNLSLFYFRYIFKYSSQMNIMDSDVFFDKYIKKDFEEKYVPHQFEEICRQYLIRCNKNGLIGPVFEKIGKYYYDDPVNRKNGEFDIVTEDENGYVFYEVKFRKEPLSEAEILKETEQVRSSGLNCYKYVFITRAGISRTEADNVKHISLSDLYAKMQ